MRIIVAGGGIIGAAVALDLVRRGAEVWLYEAGAVASGASGKSFGWINASFHLSEEHFRLRLAGIDAWHRWQAREGLAHIDWCGALWWEEQGAGLERMAARLSGMGYPVETWERATIALRIPGLGQLPERALHFPSEGAAEAGPLTRALVSRAQARGAHVVEGAAVRNLIDRDGRIGGIVTDQGMVEADAVVLACGTGAPALLAPLGMTLAMPPRPGALLRTRPLPKLWPKILVHPDMELRQDAQGRIVAPTVPSHQADRAEAMSVPLERQAAETLARLAPLLPGRKLEIESITLGMRPIPGDEFPVIGPAGPDGLWLATMHSGVTLAAIAAESLGAQIMGAATEGHAAPFHPARLLGAKSPEPVA